MISFVLDAASIAKPFPTAFSLLSIAAFVLSTGPGLIPGRSLYVLASTFALVFTLNVPAFAGVPKMLVFNPASSSSPILLPSVVIKSFVTSDAVPGVSAFFVT